LAKGLGIESALDGRMDLHAWARALDDGPHEKRADRPAPRPPVAARPRTLSVTEIETWLRDPYAIYAKHVLRLRPLDAIDEEPGPRQRGNAIHAALERFLTAFPAALPPDAMAHLLRLGQEAFAEAGATEAVLALWTPRFVRAAHWFLAYERGRRNQITKSYVEVKGSLEIPAREKFILRGRADRIDFLADGAASLLDYKTGRVPTDKQIEKPISPQLPLEGAMLLEGALGDHRAASLRKFIHVRLTGAEPPGVECVAELDANALADKAITRLVERVARYDDPAQPYLSRVMPFRKSDEGDYDHLARVREWTLEERLDE
jgi:ATP-dependent helicase/nuclease subunit B